MADDGSPANGSPKPIGVRVSGDRAIVEAPLDDFTDDEVFKWCARTATDGEITDRVPDRPHDFLFFPEASR